MVPDTVKQDIQRILDTLLAAADGSTPLNVTGGGGGTQYTEGDVDASITGNAMMMEGAGNALVAAQGTASDGLLVNLGSNNDVTISGTPTVQATDLDIRALVNTDVVTAELSAVDNAVLDTIAAKDFATQTTLAAINTKLASGTVIGDVNLGAVDNAVLDSIAAKDFATQTTLAAINAKMVTGTDIGDVTINNAAGAAAVNIQDGGNTITVDGTVTANLAAGTNNIGDVDILSIAAGNNNIGDVDIASIAAGDNNIGNVDIVSGTITTVSTLTGGGIAHDSADSGNPHKIGYKAFSPDGTTPGTAVAENDRTDAKGDLDGRLFVNDEHPRYWSYHLNTSTAQTDTSVQADPGDGFQIVITDIQFSNGAATAINMFLEEGASTIWGPVYLEAINGRGYVWKGKKHVTASTALTLTTSSSTAHSVEILGYIQAV